MAIEFAAILEQTFVPESLSQCNSNGCYCAAKGHRTLFEMERGI